MTIKISGLMPLLKRQAWCAFYRWEFIRRSEFYRADIDRFFELFGDCLRAHGVEMEKLPEYAPRFWLVEIQPKLLANAKSIEFYHNKIGPFLIALQMKWGISFPLHTSYRFDPMTWNIGIDALPVLFVLDENVDLKVGLDDLLAVATDRMRKVVETRLQKFIRNRTEGLSGLTLHFPSFIYSEKIDLTLTGQQRRNVKDVFDRVPEIWKDLKLGELLDLSPQDEQLALEILKQIVGYLDQKREIILWPVDPASGKAAHHLEFNRLMDRFEWPDTSKDKLTDLLDERSPGKKIHLDKLKEYLDIWDRRQRTPCPTNAEIVQELFPNDYNDAQAGAINTRVERAYKKAQAFIDGDFRQIK